MDTPISNYLKGERELDRQPYSSEGISRRGFLKGVAALGGAAAIFGGEGLLKQMEAWAEDGVSVYIVDNFEVTGDIPQGYYQGVDRQIPMKLATILRNRGVNVITRPDKIKDDTIVIRGMFYLKEKDPQMRTGYLGLATESIELNIQFENNGSLLPGKIYKRDARQFPDPMLDEVGYDVAGYLNTISAGKIPRSDKVSGSVQQKERKRHSIDDNTKRMLEDPKTRPLVIKHLKSLGYEVDSENRVFEYY